MKVTLTSIEDKILKENISKAIYNVTEDPAHKIGSNERGLNNLYTPEMYEELENRVFNIIKYIHLDDPTYSDSTKARLVNSYVMSNVQIRHEYFDAFEERIPEIPQSELKYRTAYAALVDGETMCAGFAEACRILLESVGINTLTLLSRLPGRNKRLLHYVTLAEMPDGSVEILDPEREGACLRKGYNFEEYRKSMDFIVPTETFFENKVGKNGVGMDVNEYIKLAHKNTLGSRLILLEDGDAIVVGPTEPVRAENSSVYSCKTRITSLVKGNIDPNCVYYVHGPQQTKNFLSILNKMDKNNHPNWVYPNKLNLLQKTVQPSNDETGAEKS